MYLNPSYELYHMDEKILNDFLIEKWKWISYAIYAYFCM